MLRASPLSPAPSDTPSTFTARVPATQPHHGARTLSTNRPGALDVYTHVPTHAYRARRPHTPHLPGTMGQGLLRSLTGWKGWDEDAIVYGLAHAVGWVENACGWRWPDGGVDAVTLTGVGSEWG